MECEEVLRRIWEYLDRELGQEESASIGEHLYGCPSCTPTYRCHRAFLDLLARQRRSCSAPVSLVLRVRSLAN